MDTRLRGGGAASSEARNTALSGRNRRADPVRLASSFRLASVSAIRAAAYRELREAIGLALCASIQPSRRFKLCRLAGDPDRLVVEGERGDRCTTSFAREQAAPGPAEVRG